MLHLWGAEGVMNLAEPDLFEQSHGASAATSTRSFWPPSHQLGLDQCADFFKPLVVKIGGVGSVDHFQRLVITSGGGELFKPRLRDKRYLDVGSSGKLKKRRLVLPENHARSPVVFLLCEPLDADRRCSS